MTKGIAANNTHPFAPTRVRRWCWFATLLAAALLAGCASRLPVPTAGPSTEAVGQVDGRVQLVDVDDAVARTLQARRATTLFSEALGTSPPAAPTVGIGDALEVNIWEASPATLFGSGATAAAGVRGAQGTSRAVTLPEQTVGGEGSIQVPFAGSIRVAGRTLADIERDIARQLRGKANQPQVLVRSVRAISSMATVVGEVGASTRLPLTAKGERLLDALAAAGGTRQPVDKMTIQVTRGAAVHSLPLQTIIRDPRQNVPLRPDDVITALFQPLSFTALGATGKNDEVPFEAQGITLSQALARVGGLLDNRADAQGLFLFRFEAADALPWPRQPVAATADGRVPVVYRVDLRNPVSFFAMQNFPMEDKDVVFVSNAPIADLQKFLNVIFSALFPALNVIQLTR